MNVLNLHERKLNVPTERVGALIDSLASHDDTLWPKQAWPRMEFDRALSLGAVGGHGPIRYFVEDYIPGQSIRFRFTGPRGFNGYHGYEVLNHSPQSCILRHTLEMATQGPAIVSWPLVFRPLHDALIEDSLALAQASLGESLNVQKWSIWVKVLRWFVSKGRSRSQVTPVTPPKKTLREKTSATQN